MTHADRLKQMSRAQRLRRRIVQVVVWLVGLGTVTALLGLAGFYWYIVRPLPVIDSLQDYRPKLITRILAQDGQIVRSLAEERRMVVPIEVVPQHVMHAFVASEDSSFYTHDGLDYKGIVRAMWENIKAGGVAQGGSTITQQVAKTFLLSSDRNIVRKMQDMVLARRIEQRLQKNEILYLYLNQIYLGDGAYGIEAAAQSYFGKSVGQLSIAEAAMIVGVVPAPERFSPAKHPERAKNRQQLVLGRMLEESYITQEQHDQARDEKVVVVRREREVAEVASQYFVEEVRRYLIARYGEEEVLTGGLQVQTTCDVTKQVAAWKAIRDGLREHDHRIGYRGPIRVVNADERKQTIEKIGQEERGEDAGELPRNQALVVAVDDEKQQVQLALAPDRTTTLALADIDWARPADPEKDGANKYVTKVSEALQPGWLVWLEQVSAEGGKPRYALYQKPDAQGALLAMNVETGHLEAMIGGYDFDDSQFNRATQAKRQPGSSFKPFIYAEALRHGYTQATVVYDTPMVFTDDLGNTWKPRNYSYEFYGPITMREALANSRNIATIKVLQDIGVRSVLDRAEAVGITSPLKPDLTLGLGSSGVSLMELVRAYTTFPTGGRVVRPVYIREIKDRAGKVLEENVLLGQSPENPTVVEDPPSIPGGAYAAEATTPEPPAPALGPETAVPAEPGEGGPIGLTAIGPQEIPPGYALDPVTSYLMVDMLRAVVEEGTAKRLQELQRPLAGKTGTTNDLFDAWFVGFTPNTVAGVWVGYDNLRSLGRNETGTRAASPIFLEYARRALADQPKRDFEVPQGVEFARIDRKTGRRSLDAEAVFLPFAAGTAPEEFVEAPGPDGTDSTTRPTRLD